MNDLVAVDEGVEFGFADVEVDRVGFVHRRQLCLRARGKMRPPEVIVHYDYYDSGPCRFPIERVCFQDAFLY